MYRPNFCAECGEQIARKSWRIWRQHFCQSCSVKYGKLYATRFSIAGIVVLMIGFSAGRYLRPPTAPLVIHRSVKSPISDLPLDLDNQLNRAAESDSPSVTRVAEKSDDAVYICGARTKKGTPCRRRVHFAGERCYQHKGRPAIVPLDKLVVKNA